MVCDGNHCRSPIGEALLRAVADGRFTVFSAGLTALDGIPPDLEAQRLMAERGLDISGHRGRQLTPAMAVASDLILVMDERQREDLGRMVPAARGRVFLMGHWRETGEREIPDPFRRGSEVFRKTVDQIDQAIQDWLKHLIPRQRLA